VLWPQRVHIKPRFRADRAPWSTFTPSPRTFRCYIAVLRRQPSVCPVFKRHPRYPRRIPNTPQQMAVVRAAADDVYQPGQTPSDRRAQTVTVTVAFVLTCILLCLFTRLYMRWPWSKMLAKKHDGLAIVSTVRVDHQLLQPYTDSFRSYSRLHKLRRWKLQSAMDSAIQWTTYRTRTSPLSARYVIQSNASHRAWKAY
jgi:hypothetical protein